MCLEEEKVLLLSEQKLMAYLLLLLDSPACFTWNEYNIIRSLFIKAKCKHSKVIAVNLIIRFPRRAMVTLDDNCFLHFLEEYKQHLLKSGVDLQYMWMREQESPYKQHYYNLLMFIDLDKSQYSACNFYNCDYYWARALQKYYNNSDLGPIEQHYSYMDLPETMHMHGVICKQGHCMVQGEYPTQEYLLDRLTTDETHPTGPRIYGYYPESRFYKPMISTSQ